MKYDFDKAFKHLIEQVENSTTSGEALHYTQALENLAHAKVTLDTVRPKVDSSAATGE